jgi:hypothetical protein
MLRRSTNSTRQNVASVAAMCLCVLSEAALGDELPSLPIAVPGFNRPQVEDYYPVFDFDGNGCYPATPFNKNDNLSQNPGLASGGHTIAGQCHDDGWWNYANTLHRQLCNQKNENGVVVRRCAHFYELYFEKDQVTDVVDKIGHRHDIETVIVWTGSRKNPDGSSIRFVSHVSVSAHDNYTTRHITETIHNLGHAYVVYHKGGTTHSFRFANQGDRDHVEFIGNKGDFFTPSIVSYYTAYKFWNNSEWDRYWQNVQFRNKVENSDFGDKPNFKMRNKDNKMLDIANKAMPRWDSFWSGFSFSQGDIDWTRNEELWSNYPSVRNSLPE